MAESIIKQISNNSASTYCKMPDGTLIQWGFDNIDNTGLLSKTFSLNFTTLPVVVGSWTFNDNSNVTGDIGALKIIVSRTTGFQATIGGNVPSNMVGKLAVKWIAIGRWK